MRAQRFLFALAMTLAALAISRSFGVAAVSERERGANSRSIVSVAPTKAVGAASSAEVAMLADARDGHLDEHSLLRAALIASGSEDPLVWQACEQRLHALVKDFLAADSPSLPMAERAAAMHALLFRRVLTGVYDAQVNNLAELFSVGRYNCVTASTLLMAFAAECDLETEAVEAPAHVLVIVDPRGAAVPVEMTSRDWRSSSSLGAGRSTSLGRKISAEQLLATYYHNRGVQRLAERDFAGAVTANRTALALDADCQAARQNLLASLSGWALTLAEAGEIPAALRKIDAALEIEPNSEPLRENRVFIELQSGVDSPAPRSARLTPRVGPIAPKFF
jgi:tetratricopeptide (TPR) repeat protein